MECLPFINPLLRLKFLNWILDQNQARSDQFQWSTGKTVLGDLNPDSLGDYLCHNLLDVLERLTHRRGILNMCVVWHSAAELMHPERTLDCAPYQVVSDHLEGWHSWSFCVLMFCGWQMHLTAPSVPLKGVIQFGTLSRISSQWKSSFSLTTGEGRVLPQMFETNRNSSCTILVSLPDH